MQRTRDPAERVARVDLAQRMEPARAVAIAIREGVDRERATVARGEQRTADGLGDRRELRVLGGLERRYRELDAEEAAARIAAQPVWGLAHDAPRRRHRRAQPDVEHAIEPWL